jgi:hypothetical protein
MGSQMLRGAQHDTTGSLVILSAAKDLTMGSRTLRGVSPERSEWAQGDRV